MRRAIAISIGLLLIGSLRAAPPGGTATFTKLKLHIESHPVGHTIYHGYTAHRFTIHNSASEKRRITFTLPARNHSDDFNINHLTRSFTISPGTQTVTILQPPLPMGYNEEVKIKCEGQERFIPRGIGLRMADGENCGRNRPRVVLLSQGFNKPAMDKAVQALFPKGSGHGGHGGHFSHGGGPYSDTHAEFQYEADETAKWPRHWLAYSCYDMIVMKGEQWKRTPSDVRTAIERWVLCGGKLAIFGEGFDPPKGWNKVSDPITTTHNIGLGEVREYNQNELPHGGVPETIAKWLGADDPENNQKSIPLLGGLQTAVNELHNEWGGSERDFNSYFRVIGTARTPVRLVIIVLTLFVLIAGPVNLFILNRKEKRSWFLWTLPVISFATSGVVFVVSFFSEGVTPRLRTDSITILNQVNQEATTLGAVAIYAPIAPSQLDFSGQSEVTPLFDSGYAYGPFGRSRNHDSGSNRQVEWSEGGEQRLTGKWIGSRVPAHFAVRKTEHREERIQVQWPGTEPEIINGLGGHIDQIYLAGPNGRLFGGRDIGPGKKVLLNPITGSLKSHPPKQSGRADYSSTTKLVNSIAKLASADDQDIDAISPEIVPANRYWARLSSQKNPFLENPLRDRTSKHKTQIHVVGILISNGSAQ
jgi:hypothetical protein